MNGAEHAVFRRLFDEYAQTVPKMIEECEICAVPGSDTRAIRLTTAHKEEAFELVKKRGFDVRFVPGAHPARFCDDTDEAIIEAVYEVGDVAWLCNACAKVWVKAHVTTED